MKRVVKPLLALGIVAAVVAWLQRRPAPPSASPTAPPYPVAPRTPAGAPPVAEEAAPVDAPVVAAPDTVPAPAPVVSWVEPGDGGTCPDGFPVKAKTGSRIFHVPEGSLYERTVPDRCYVSAEAAEADGYRQSKR